MRHIFFIMTGVAEASLQFPQIKKHNQGSAISEVSRSGSIFHDEVPEGHGELNFIDLNFGNERIRRQAFRDKLPARKVDDDEVFSAMLEAKTVQEVNSLAMSAMLDPQISGDTVKLEKIKSIRDIALKSFSEGWRRPSPQSPPIQQGGDRRRDGNSKTNSLLDSRLDDILKETRNTLDEVAKQYYPNLNGNVKLPSIKVGGYGS